MFVGEVEEAQSLILAGLPLPSFFRKKGGGGGCIYLGLRLIDRRNTVE